MKFYAGIGSREITDSMKRVMTSIAMELCQEGYTLRSGNAEGSDQAFANGVLDKKAQIWLPWGSFNVDFQIKHNDHSYNVISPIDREAWESVDKFHPNTKGMNNSVRSLMARNYRQVIGKGEPNSQFVICWTRDGGPTGGTGQAIRIANHYNIPVFNLFNMNKDEILKEITKLNLLS